jgi:hypothetical protein
MLALWGERALTCFVNTHVVQGDIHVFAVYIYIPILLKLDVCWTYFF